MSEISKRFLNTFPPDDFMEHSYYMAEDPVMIWGNLYFVGNSWCSSHLIDTGEGLILLDTGCRAELPWLLDSIWRLGFNPHEIKKIIISHAHHDHYGAARSLVYLTGAKTYISRVDGEDMLASSERIDKMNHQRIPPDEVFQADILLDDGDIIELGNTKIRCVLTPGHTVGVMSHFWDVYRGNESKHVGIYGGAGFGMLSEKSLRHNGMPQYLRKSFLDSIDKVWDENVDIMLGNHPCHNDTFIKAARLTSGDAEAFVDPDEWKRFLLEMRNSYNKFLSLSDEEDKELFENSGFLNFCGINARSQIQYHAGHFVHA